MKPKDLKGNRFALTFYEGYKGKETPRSVIIGNREFKVERVLDRKRVRDERTGKCCDIFTCEMGGERVRLIIHESELFEISFV